MLLPEVDLVAVELVLGDPGLDPVQVLHLEIK